MGKEIADSFLERGASVIIFDWAPAEELSPDFRRALLDYRQVDLGDRDELLSACLHTMQRTADRLDILVNNAWPRVFSPFASFSPDEIVHCLQRSLQASFLLTHFAMQKMKANGFGRIINISSRSAFSGYSSGALYCSTKMALVTFHESLSRELKHMNEDLAILTLCPDAFSEPDGSISAGGAKVIRSIWKRIIQFVAGGRSHIRYVGSTKNRLWALFHLVRKVSYILQ